MGNVRPAIGSGRDRHYDESLTVFAKLLGAALAKGVGGYGAQGGQASPYLA
jgi:hypothetical protein